MASAPTPPAPPGGPWRLRRLRWWDLAAVLALERLLFPADAWSAGTLWSELAGVPATRHYLCAEDPGGGPRDGAAGGPGGGLVGYAGLRAVDRVGDVQTLAVAPAAQGRGLGRALLAELLAEAARRRCREVFLEVRADNAAALALYRGAGFDRVDVRRGYYSGHPPVDALVLRRRLPRPVGTPAGIPSSP